MDPKLTILFLLISAIIGLFHLSDLLFARRRQQPTLRLTSPAKARPRA